MNTPYPLHFPNQILLVLGEQAATPWMLTLAAHLCLRGTVRVLDAGNRFNVYPVARALRRQRHDPYSAFQHIHLSRAFTCYQVDALLQEWQGSASILLVFDLLATFYDESVDMAESQRLLQVVLARLGHLSHSMPVVISTRLPAASCAERLLLFDLLKEYAGEIRYELQAEAAPAALQLSLFPKEV
jgi:hypothetical protein